MTWLPTWSDAREILRAFGVADKDVQVELERSQALKDGSELLQLYELIAQHLSEPHETANSQRCQRAGFHGGCSGDAGKTRVAVEELKTIARNTRRD